MIKKLFTILLFCCSCLQVFSQATITDSILHEGVYRDYFLYVPAIYDDSQPVPLLLNLHGYSSNNFEQYVYADFKPIADTANFIMVLPNGTFDGFGFRFWNCFTEDGMGVDDVQFLSNLIDSISAEYQIDANRIYSTGFSNGGFMSYTLAGELSNKIAAVASVSGSIDKDRFPALNPQHPIPVMQIHGNADFTVPYNGTTDFLDVDSVINFWVTFNHCNPEAEYIEVPDINTSDLCTAEHYIYKGGDNEADVELFKIIDGGHTWPGTVFSYIGVTNQDIFASNEIWRFFRKYSLNALTGLEENTEQIPFTLFPNPASQEIQLKISDGEKIKTISTFNITGEHIQLNWNEALQADISTLANGIYFTQIRTENGSAEISWIKMEK